MIFPGQNLGIVSSCGRVLNPSKVHAGSVVERIHTLIVSGDDDDYDDVQPHENVGFCKLVDFFLRIIYSWFNRTYTGLSEIDYP